MKLSARTGMLVALLALLAGLLTPTAASGAADDEPPTKDVEESDTGSYIVVMLADPLIATEGQDNLASGAARERGEDLRESHTEALEEAGVPASSQVHSYVNALNGFSAVLSHDQAQKVAGSDGVAMVMPDRMRYIDSDSSPAFLQLTGSFGAWANGLTGEGVVVGVIDSGIWPEHPSFADDGTYDPPTGVASDIPCEFGNTAHNPLDVPFTCNNKLIGARQVLDTYRSLIGADPDEHDSARDDDGHGTHTAATAAGNADVRADLFGRRVGKISGIAPRAQVIAYKGLGNLGGFGSDLAASIDQAVADGVDVINYSVGGGPSLTGPDDIAFLFAANAGVYVATSAGNSGPDPATLGGPGTVPWLTTVGANTQPRFFEASLQLGDGSQYAGASVTGGIGETRLVDGADVGGDLCIPDTLDPEAVDGAIVLCRRGAIGRAAKSKAVLDAGGVGMVLYENTDDNNLFTDTHWVPSVHIDNTPGLAVKAYIASNGGGATAQIGEWDRTRWEAAPSMTIFSSRGPNPVAESIIKPDITAPGMQILSANSPTPDPGAVPGQMFQAISGTSMSSPHIAGIFALVKQARPEWTPAMAKSAIMTTAYQKDVVDNDRQTPADPFAMGAGHVDPRYPRAVGSIWRPGLVYDAGFLDYLGFLCEAGPEILNPTTCPSLEASGIPTRAVDLNLPSIGVAQLAGTETVQRTVTSVTFSPQTFDVSVEAPPGYDVVVTPSQLTLAPGESATYSVTITNNGGGAIGSWSHGALTWKSGSYHVRSSISVKGAQIGVADEVTGSGTSGNASVDVKFGYSGAYQASANGLAAETITSDRVVQDPDQNFDPTDGFSNQHDFEMNNAAHFRIAMPPEATIADADIDIYVADPSGTIVATSTSGGTDELIDIASPANGTWSVYIHGWAAPGVPDTPYDLSTWIVPTEASSLSIDQAPASATVGETGVIELSWSGLTAGTSYLGTVSHSDGTGIVASTLVSVDG